MKKTYCSIEELLREHTKLSGIRSIQILNSDVCRLLRTRYVNLRREDIVPGQLPESATEQELIDFVTGHTNKNYPRYVALSGDYLSLLEQELENRKLKITKDLKVDMLTSSISKPFSKKERPIKIHFKNCLPKRGTKNVPIEKADIVVCKLKGKREWNVRNVATVDPKFIASLGDVCPDSITEELFSFIEKSPNLYYGEYCTPANVFLTNKKEFHNVDCESIKDRITLLQSNLYWIPFTEWESIQNSTEERKPLTIEMASRMLSMPADEKTKKIIARILTDNITIDSNRNLIQAVVYKHQLTRSTDTKIKNLFDYHHLHTRGGTYTNEIYLRFLSRDCKNESPEILSCLVKHLLDINVLQQE